jgi:CheY-like chemotaxis protein
MATQSAHPTVVLVVEDHDDSREMYCRFLQTAGYWTLGAANGREGLAAVRRYRPQVVVTDIGMPGMDGWEFAQALRENDLAHDICIIAVSGWATHDGVDRPACLSSVDVVLTKPCLPEDLLREIQNLLARRRLARLPAHAQIANANDARGPSAGLIERSAKPPKRRSRDGR